MISSNQVAQNLPATAKPEIAPPNRRANLSFLAGQRAPIHRHSGSATPPLEGEPPPEPWSFRWRASLRASRLYWDG